jgi:hypothetical protein
MPPGPVPGRMPPGPMPPGRVPPHFLQCTVIDRGHAQASPVSARDFDRMDVDAKRYSVTTKIEVSRLKDKKDPAKGKHMMTKHSIYIAHKRANWRAYINHSSEPNISVESATAKLEYTGDQFVPGGCFLSWSYGDNYFERL